MVLPYNLLRTDADNEFGIKGQIAGFPWFMWATLGRRRRVTAGMIGVVY